MADVVALFTRSLQRFVDRVDHVTDDQWSAATPCAGWDVRQLVNHVTNEQLWAPHLVDGESIAEVGDRYDGDVLGLDPPGSLHTAAAGSSAAFARADLDALVHLSFGDLPCGEYLVQMLTDTEVHGWDVAVATGQDATLDPEVVAVLLPAIQGMEDLIRASGMFGDATPVGDDADDAARVLGLLGRQPHEGDAAAAP